MNSSMREKLASRCEELRHIANHIEQSHRTDAKYLRLMANELLALLTEQQEPVGREMTQGKEEWLSPEARFMYQATPVQTDRMEEIRALLNEEIAWRVNPAEDGIPTSAHKYSLAVELDLIAPQQDRDREASVIHGAIQILAQMPKKEWDAWGRSTAQRLDRYEQVLATQEADDE